MHTGGRSPLRRDGLAGRADRLSRRLRPMDRPRRAAIGLLTVAAMLLSTPVASAAAPIPNQVYAPYFETWVGSDFAGTAQASGARYFTLAFLETTGKSS